MSKLLPQNSTPLERALADAHPAQASQADAIRALWNPETCPSELLPWLAWTLSVDDWSADWSERQKRDTVKIAHAVGVTRFLNPAYDLDSSRRAAALAQARPDVGELLGDGPLGAGLAHAKQEGTGRRSHGRES